MKVSKYVSVRAGSSNSNGQGQSYAPIILGVTKGDKTIFVTVPNICVFRDKNDVEVLLITANAGIKSLGKLDYIRSQEGFRKAVYRITNDKKFGATITIDRDLEPFRG